MPLNTTQLAQVRARFVAPPSPMVLYHGTDDARFYSMICSRHGFNSREMFMGYYSLRPLGDTSVYGPGIYLADTALEAGKYGTRVIRFEFESTTDYLDFYDKGRKATLKATGAAMQDVLAEPQIYALVRVTANYYCLRTPFNFMVGPNPNPSPVEPIWDKAPVITSWAI